MTKEQSELTTKLRELHTEAMEARWTGFGPFIIKLRECIALSNEEERKEAAPPPRKDYDALYDFLCNGGEALAYALVDKVKYPVKAYNFYGAIHIEYHADDTPDKTRWSVRIGMRYSCDAFLDECQRLSLEWLATSKPITQ